VRKKRTGPTYITDKPFLAALREIAVAGELFVRMRSPNVLKLCSEKQWSIEGYQVRYRPQAIRKSTKGAKSGATLATHGAPLFCLSPA
jgi:hypothetical protein